MTLKTNLLETDSGSEFVKKFLRRKQEYLQNCKGLVGKESIKLVKKISQKNKREVTEKTKVKMPREFLNRECTKIY